jgi:hypothetical protein
VSGNRFNEISRGRVHHSFMTQIQSSAASLRANIATKISEVRGRMPDLATLQARSSRIATVVDYKPQVVEVGVVSRLNDAFKAQEARLNGPVSENREFSGGEMKGLSAEQIERRIGLIKSVLNDKNAGDLSFTGLNGDQQTSSPQEFLSWLEGAYANFGSSSQSRVA